MIRDIHSDSMSSSSRDFGGPDSVGPISSARLLWILTIFAVFFLGCGGAGEDRDELGLKIGSSQADFDCAGACANLNLSTEDVTRILRQGVSAAALLGVNATFAVVDRVGNVLAVYQMPGAALSSRIDGQIGAVGGLEGVEVPSSIAAITKAGSGAYLSSQGNAFSTRTASQIVQEHFNPGERNQPGGPLFGVQFSQLLCSDVTVLNPDFSAGISSGSKFKSSGLVGPRPLPLGLSADPGGIPLYEQGDLVGGLGVELDGEYRVDRDISDRDDDIEERIALMSTQGGFEIPSERAGNRIFVLGKTLRTVDLSYAELDALPEILLELDPSSLLKIPFYTDGTIRAGAVFGDASSGILRSTRAGVAAAFLVQASGAARFPTRGGATLAAGALSAAEVDALLDSALFTAFRTRAAIRRPLDTAARVSIWVVDHLGNPLGMVRNEDAPVFGLDVALQKARSAAFFSSADAGEKLSAVRARNGVGAFNDYVGAAAASIPVPLLRGQFAVTDRAIGNLARPFFVDGIDGNSNGPFSLPFPGTAGASRTWSPFNTGLQLDLAFQRLVQPLGIPQNPPASLPDSCSDSSVLGSRLKNGLQIFPGSVPLYRNGALIGGLGISGDGVDQDDLVAFFGASRAGLDAVGHTGSGDPKLGFNAPLEIRSDNIDFTPQPNTRLRYINCPEGPFRDVNDQKVCDGF